MKYSNSSDIWYCMVTALNAKIVLTGLVHKFLEKNIYAGKYSLANPFTFNYSSFLIETYNIVEINKSNK